MKTPEEIKKGLECCPGQYFGVSCGNCLYSNDGVYCGENGVRIMKDALEYIEQLEAELEAVKRERDAAVASIGEYRFCVDCKHIDASKADEPCRTCLNDETASKGGWEWRGVCPENTEVQDK